jgi:hypothetical protein
LELSGELFECYSSFSVIKSNNFYWDWWSC